MSYRFSLNYQGTWISQDKAQTASLFWISPELGAEYDMVIITSRLLQVLITQDTSHKDITEPTYATKGF
jgi:hypothetical protein